MPFELISPQNKILRHPDWIDTLRSGGVPPVANVELDLTEHCNANCATCDFPDHYKSNLDAETLDGVEAQLLSWRTRAVVLTGGGEPTIHPTFPSIANRLSRNFQLGLYTNGIALDLSKCERAFKWAYVSLDSWDEESWASHKRVAPKLYRSVLKNLEAATYYTTVGAGFLIGPDNMGEIDKMALSAMPASPSYIHFRPLWPFNWTEEEAEECKKRLLMVSALPGVQVAWAKFEDAWHWSRPYKTCWASAFIRQIDTDGNIYPCPTTRWKRRIGNVFEGCDEMPCRVTDECREGCRGHGLNKTLDYIMSSSPHDAFV